MVDPPDGQRPCCTPSADSGAAHDRATLAYRPAAADRLTDGQVLLGAATYVRGDAFDEGYASDGETPRHAVRLPAYHIDATTVTNAAFARFVDETGHVTDAERLGSSAVTAMAVAARPEAVIGRMPGAPWWLLVEGANWRHPHGPLSDLDGLEDHPAVHVTWWDAQAYCRWSGRRLPTEAEWEHAARGGRAGRRFPWGDELLPDGRWQCNIWQGRFPSENTADDGWVTTAPVASYPANDFGLYEMAGNVWEWCADHFSPTRYRECAADEPVLDPRGPSSGESMVIRGGSFMCHDSYCHRYRVSARSATPPDSSTSNVGFRCANDSGDPAPSAREGSLQP